MMLILTVDWLLIVIAVSCVYRAVRVDRELRRLLPLVIERRWRAEPDWMHVALWRYLRLDPWDWRLQGPARWERHLHAERGAILVDEFWLSVALACLALAGLGVLTAVERAAS
jgi:hypothetical protein